MSEGGEPHRRWGRLAAGALRMHLSLSCPLTAVLRCLHSSSLCVRAGHYVSYMRKQNVSEACARDAEPCAHSDSPCRLDAADLTAGWHYASDADCRPINVSDVLRAQAYIAFYCKV